MDRNNKSKISVQANLGMASPFLDNNIVLNNSLLRLNFEKLNFETKEFVNKDIKQPC